MNRRFVTYAVGKLLQVLSAVLLVPLVIAVVESRPLSWPGSLVDIRLLGFLIAVPVSFLAGTLLVLLPRRELEGSGVREGFAIVTFGWVVLTLVGCIPLFVYLLMSPAADGGGGFRHGVRCFTDAFFEIMSGFTTTGATIFPDVEVLPQGILFWRSMTHWLGGMGIVTLALAIFPAFGITAYQMFRGEVPGPTAERLKPGLAETAKILWGVYALLTVVEAMLLFFGGMSLFESFCQAFGTMATGGFSTRNASVAAFGSAYIDWVIAVFMFLAGMNFMIHYHVLFSGSLSVITTNREFHFYALVMGAAILLTVGLLAAQGPADRETAARSYRHQPLSEQAMNKKLAEEGTKVSTVHGVVRHAAFQVISLTTTTGFSTADFDLWPNALRIMLVVLMFFGGCAGSTGGGIKMVRIMVVLKTAWREVRTMIQPRLIAPVKIAGRALEEKQVANIVGFFVLFIVLFVLFSMVMSLIIGDFTTAITSVVATICNIGPGLAGVGATENYSWIPLSGKWVLAFCMLLGRLEIYTVLIAFAPISWRR